MKNPDLQIAIVTKQINKETVNYYVNNFPNYHILIVSPNLIEPYYLQKLTYRNDVDFLDRNQILKLFSIIEHEGLRDKQLIPNWYYQQLLKYQIVLQSNFRYTHIVDGDSIISPELIKIDRIFSTGKKVYTFYQKFNNAILRSPIYRRQPISYITNQMIFDKLVLKELLSQIEKKNESNWISAIVSTLYNNKGVMFSEYQLYAEYAIIHKKLKIEKIKVFRRMDLIKLRSTEIFNKYKVISYEPHHKTSLLRTLRARLYYHLGLNLG